MWRSFWEQFNSLAKTSFVSVLMLIEPRSWMVFWFPYKPFIHHSTSTAVWVYFPPKIATTQSNHDRKWHNTPTENDSHWPSNRYFQSTFLLLTFITTLLIFFIRCAFSSLAVIWNRHIFLFNYIVNSLWSLVILSTLK